LQILLLQLQLLLQLHRLPAAAGGCVSALVCRCLQELQLQRLVAAPAAGVPATAALSGSAAWELMAPAAAFVAADAGLRLADA
jgi:hypothetical protein